VFVRRFFDVNKLLTDYAIQVEYPNVSGAEHLETLQNRDLLAEMEDDFRFEAIVNV
jgi:hypothetical protein